MATTEIRTQSDIQNLPVRRYDDLASVSGFSRVSWGSIFAGSVIGLVTQFWLSLLGVAIGASTLDPLAEPNPFSGLGVGSAIWLALSVVISFFIGGWAAGRFAGTARRSESLLHGASAWAVSNMAAFLLVGSVFTGIAGGAARLTGGALTAAGNAAAAGGRAPGAANRAADAARRGANNVLTQGRLNGPAGQARKAGDEAAKAVAGTSWGVVILMFLGLCASLAGAGSATPMNSVYNRQR